MCGSPTAGRPGKSLSRRRGRRRRARASARRLPHRPLRRLRRSIRRPARRRARLSRARRPDGHGRSDRPSVFPRARFRLRHWPRRPPPARGRARNSSASTSPRACCEKAAERGVYDELIEADILSFLRSTKQRFDLALAADTLDLLRRSPAVLRRRGARHRGRRASRLQHRDCRGRPYRLLPSGRFAHDPNALAGMAAPWFRLMARRPAILRVGGQPRGRGRTGRHGAPRSSQTLGDMRFAARHATRAA